jgi:ABC-2 type transport system permease protein
MKVAYRLLFSTIVTRGRLLGLGALGAIPVLLGAALHNGRGPDASVSLYRDLIGLACVGLLAPVVSLVLASAAFGDPVDDRTLVYLWLKPVARFRLALAGLGAALTVGLPLVVAPTVLGAALAGADVRLVAGAAAAALVAVVTYSAVFLGLGLKVRRALVWGLAYVLIWEGAVAHTARGAARLSVQTQARSLLASIARHDPPRNGVAATTAVIVPVLVVLAAVALTTRWLSRADVA